MEELISTKEPKSFLDCLDDAAVVLDSWANSIEKTNQKGEHTNSIRFLRDRSRAYRKSMIQAYSEKKRLAELELRLDQLVTEKQELQAALESCQQLETKKRD